MYLLYLMHEDKKILEFKTTIDTNVIMFEEGFKILNNKYLPFCIKMTREDETARIFYEWFLSRYMERTQPAFLDLTNYLHDNYSNREYKVPVFCSLYTYAMSLSDHYWLNPATEISLGGEIDALAPFKFKLQPTTYSEARKRFLNWKDDISQLQIHYFNKDFDYMPKHENMSLLSPNFTTYGEKMKLWDKKDDNILCKKYFTKKDMWKFEKYLELSNLNLKHFLKYEKISENCLASQYFLRENEEYVDLVQLLLNGGIDEINDDSIYKFAKHFGLKRNVYKEYLKEKEVVKNADIGDKVIYDNMGFVIDSKSQKITNIINRM